MVLKLQTEEILFEIVDPVLDPKLIKPYDVEEFEKHQQHDQSSHGNWAHGGLSSKEKEIHQRITNVKRTSWENYDKYAEKDDDKKVQYIEAEYTTKDNKKYILNQENIKEPDDRFVPKVFHSIEIKAYERVRGGLKEVGRLNTEGGNSGVIEGVLVQPEYQRQGIATAMLNMARTYAPDNFEIEHSFSLTEDAKNWASIVKHQQHDQSSHGNWAGETSPNDYGMFHRPAMGEGYGASLDDVTNGIYPDDVYSPRGLQIYGTGSKNLDKKAHSLIMEYKGKPDKEIRIYRAVPKKVSSKINTGDWVTPIKEYAIQHGESYLNNDYQILFRDVKAKEIFTSGDSWLEWGYSPESIEKHQQHDQSSHGNWATDGSYPTEAVVSTEIYEAVYNYANRGFKEVNYGLRAKEAGIENNYIVEGMDLVIKSTPALTEDKTLLRGIRDGIADKLLDSKVGDEFQDNGFISATEDINIARFFSASPMFGNREENAIMVIDVPKGTKAFQPRKFFVGQDESSDLWGALQSEDEYILARGTKFQITEIDKETRTVNVKVRT